MSKGTVCLGVSDVEGNGLSRSLGCRRERFVSDVEWGLKDHLGRIPETQCLGMRSRSSKGSTCLKCRPKLIKKFVTINGLIYLSCPRKQTSAF